MHMHKQCEPYSVSTGANVSSPVICRLFYCKYVRTQSSSSWTICFRQTQHKLELMMLSNVGGLWGVCCGTWPATSHNSVVDLHWQLLPFHYLLNLAFSIKLLSMFPMFVIENIFNKPAISKTGCLCTFTISVFLFLCWNGEWKWGDLFKSWDSVQRLYTSSHQYTWHIIFSYLWHISFI